MVRPLSSGSWADADSASMTDPAGMKDPDSILTGATTVVLDERKTPSPTVLVCLATPSLLAKTVPAETVTSSPSWTSPA